MPEETLNSLLEARSQSQRWCSVLAEIINTEWTSDEPISESQMCYWFGESGLRLVHVEELVDAEGEAEALMLAFLDSVTESNHSE